MEKNMHLSRRAFLLQTTGTVAAVKPDSAVFSVKEFGAVGDGTQLDTAKLQAAIDFAGRAGGGTVLLTAGRYVTGTLNLRSNVTLHLSAGAVLLGSTNLADYPVKVAKVRSYTDNYTDKSLLYGEDLENVGIEGGGVIDGRGKEFRGPYKVRPYLLRLVGSTRVRVSDVGFRDSAMWVQHYLGCENVVIRGVSVHSRVNGNNDGIDIDGCDRVRISDCDISSGDDAIVIKSTLSRPAKNITVTNCVLSTHCNALKLGTESNGGFENITVSNCSIYDTRLSGIAVECVDGGKLERVQFSGITMDGVGAPVFIRLGDRGRPYVDGGARQPAGTLRRVLIRDVQAVRASTVGCAIAGLPGSRIEDVTLDNLRLQFDGGGKASYPAGAVPEHPDKYPEHHMFGTLPAYGFFCRHVRGITFRNVRVESVKPESRPRLVTEDVEGLTIEGSNL